LNVDIWSKLSSKVIGDMSRSQIAAQANEFDPEEVNANLTFVTIKRVEAE